MKLIDVLPGKRKKEIISPGELNRMMARSDVVILDVNSRQSWMKTRVPGALNLDPDRFSKTDLPADKSKLLVFYCSNPMCRKAPKAAFRAKNMGYTNVRVMRAGIRGWILFGLPVEKGAG